MSPAILCIIGCCCADADPTALREAVQAITASPREGRGKSIQERLRRLEVPFTLSPFDGGENIAVRFDAAPRPGAGGDGSPAGKFLLILGAHFDRVAVGEGAVDNAASCAILLETARALKRAPPPVRVAILFFDREEDGLRGSKAFIEKELAGIREGLEPHYINLDVNAYGETVFFGPLNGRQGFIAAALQGAMRLEDQPSLGSEIFPPSDDRSFAAAGIDNISVSILPREDAQAAIRFLTRQSTQVPEILRLIHSVEDRLEKVDAKSMVRISRLIDRVIHLCGLKMERY